MNSECAKMGARLYHLFLKTVLGLELKKALYNYMYGMGFDLPISFWFGKTVNEPNIASDFIEQTLN
ncbi:MAG: hypothetical protein HFP78_08700 [Methylococcales symbiont of Hymedesmia sp. n. MRB-2018]|nr:MAG: hypothetical protein HFP78_08700 [Methylococcales symbiont of Hymedesmia sp. n. MRB-2018]